MKPSDTRRSETKPPADEHLQTEGVKHPAGSDPDDPAFRQAYPYGTYGYGPKGRLDEPATLAERPSPRPGDTVDQTEAVGHSEEAVTERGESEETRALSALIDFERPETSLSKAQEGEKPGRTGER
jgi:hypothetical protein